MLSHRSAPQLEILVLPAHQLPAEPWAAEPLRIGNDCAGRFRYQRGPPRTPFYMRFSTQVSNSRLAASFTVMCPGCAPGAPGHAPSLGSAEIAAPRAGRTPRMPRDPTQLAGTIPWVTRSRGRMQRERNLADMSMAEPEEDMWSGSPSCCATPRTRSTSTPTSTWKTCRPARPRDTALADCPSRE